MTILVRELRAEIERLQVENSRLRDALADKVVDSTKLRTFLLADGGFTIGLEGGPCALLADAFGEQLYTSEAINYLQLTFTSGAYPDLGEIVVTLQRCTGKTPHELRIGAERERDQLKAENAELRRGRSALDAIATMPADQIRDTYNWAYYAPREIGSDAEQIRAGMTAVLRKAMTKEQP